MADANAFPARHSHIAVHMENCIVVFGGLQKDHSAISLDIIWMYNLYTEQWGKHVIQDAKKLLPRTTYPCAAVVEADIYIFGGFDVREHHHTNAVWKLTRTQERHFEWSNSIARSNKKTPSPRYRHCGWAYAGQLWTFGGIGEPLKEYLHDHGDFNGSNDDVENNQLLFFNPYSEEWKNPNTFGTVPSPRESSAATITGNKVFVYGGKSPFISRLFDDLYQLDMISLTWMEIQITHLRPPPRILCSFNALTEHNLVLHGGTWKPELKLNDTWMLDLSSLSWQKHITVNEHPRNSHSGTAGLNCSVIIIGGQLFCWNKPIYHLYNDTVSVRLKPKTLRQLAIQKIYLNQDVLSFNLLPNSLTALFLFPALDTDGDK